MIPPVARRLPDGRRLHMQHGPMDLIVDVDAPEDVRARAETAAVARFETILGELVPQLDVLRAPLGGSAPSVEGTVARRMVAAASAFADVWVTPMVAVAGSVADEVRSTIEAVPGVRRAYVNNGGDVSLHVTAGAELRVGLVASIEDGRADQALVVDGTSAIRGLATSGAGGRSHSLGIADAVTVVGTCAAFADAAASLVANAVDLPGHPAIERLPARELDPDSDLGDQLVTVAVGELDDDAVEEALDRGAAEARRRLDAVPELMGVVLHLRGRRRLVGADLADRVTPLPAPEPEVARAG